MLSMLKADLHLHTYDKRDGVFYTPEELIDRMSELGFDVIAITNHWRVTYDANLRNYAKKKGILLIPGAELRVNGKDVLAYNIRQEDIKRIKCVRDLNKIKDRKHLVIAPHPYFVLGQCLGKSLEKHIELFDAIEYSHFYIRLLNFNKKAEEIAIKFKKPIVGNSDAHHLWQVGHTYTFIDADKNVQSVIDSVKKGKLKIVTEPLSIFQFFLVLMVVAKSKFYKTIYCIKRFIKHLCDR